MSLRVMCLYRYNSELRMAQSLKSVLVGAYDRLEAAAPLTRRQHQSMRIIYGPIAVAYQTCDNQSRIVCPREGTSTLINI